MSEAAADQGRSYVFADDAYVASLRAGGLKALLACRARMQAIVDAPWPPAPATIGGPPLWSEPAAVLDRWSARKAVEEIDAIVAILTSETRTPAPPLREKYGRLFGRADLDVDDIAPGLPGYLTPSHDIDTEARAYRGEYTRRDVVNLQRRPCEVTGVTRLGKRGFVTAITVRDEISEATHTIRRGKSWPSVFATGPMDTIAESLGGRLVAHRKRQSNWPIWWALRLGSKT